MELSDQWRHVFLSRLAEPFQNEAKAVLAEQDHLTPSVHHALETWPSIEFPPQAFVESIARCMNQSPSPKGVEDWLKHLQAPDLYLAQACVHQVTQALVAFEHTFDKTLKSLAARFAKPPLTEEDLLQSLMEKLFVGNTDQPPKLASYAGQGFLENWLRVTATRTFLDITRASQSQQERERFFEEDKLAQLSEQALDLELEFLKQEYRTQFKTAFNKAIASLTAQERNILRQYLHGGLSIDQLGALYNIHRSTAARRLAKARRNLLVHTQQQLMSTLQISEDEYDSIMRLIQSRLEVSFHRLLRIDEAGQPQEQ